MLPSVGMVGLLVRSAYDPLVATVASPVMSPTAWVCELLAAPMSAAVMASDPPVACDALCAAGAPPPSAAMDASVTEFVAVPEAFITGTTLVPTAPADGRAFIFTLAKDVFPQVRDDEIAVVRKQQAIAACCCLFPAPAERALVHYPFTVMTAGMLAAPTTTGQMNAHAYVESGNGWAPTVTAVMTPSPAS